MRGRLEIDLPKTRGRQGGACRWVDPRSQPAPSTRTSAERIAEDPTEISPLIDLCRTGRIYSIERWIAAGRPIQHAYQDKNPWHGPATPLSVAIESGQYDLAFLLLCNGYRTDLEPHKPLDLALRKRAWDYVELLLAWGADPKAVEPTAVLDTYSLSLMERFWDLGLDLTAGRSLAYYLSESTRNKPAYGWAKRHNGDLRVARALALALGEAVWEEREKAVALLVWAGADPHRKVPSLRYSTEEDESEDDPSSAIELAVTFGHGKLLRYMVPDPALDDFDELYDSVCDPDALDRLFDIRPPRDWSRAIWRNISRMGWWFSDRSRSRACLERIFEHHWGRLCRLDRPACQDLRRTLLKLEYDYEFAWILRTLSKPHHCDEGIFAEIVRTPSIRQRIDRAGLSELLPSKPTKEKVLRVADKRRVKPGDEPEPSPEERWLASLSPKDRAEVLRHRISREQLYEEVWAEPIIKVAGRYGVSDVAVAKWCRRLAVPRPGRGYWARKAAGRILSQPPLPAARSGQPRYVARPEPSEKKYEPPSRVPDVGLFKNPIPVSAFSDPEHPLVAMTRRAIKESSTQEHGVTRPHGEGVLDVSVSESSAERALQILNAALLALDAAGFAVEVTGAPDPGDASGRRTFAVIRGEKIPFYMTEKTVMVERPPTDEERLEMRRSLGKRGPFYTYRSTGQLTLWIDVESRRVRGQRSWTDGKRLLEERLHLFLRGLVASAGPPPE